MKNSFWLVVALFCGQGALAQTAPADTGWAYQEQPCQKAALPNGFGFSVRKVRQNHNG